ncbi:MAG: hypothetical protein OXP70_04500 [Acidobacteriota bacterium]|nr:hypothetical protein [Acidobacteriota bacterium]
MPAAPSTSTVCGSIEPTAPGVRFGTVTTKLCTAVRPPGSVAVAVTVANPFARASNVTAAPAAEMARTLSSDTDIA